MPRNEPTSELVNATAVVEAELQRFEDATAAFSKLSLNSQKNLEKAKKALNELADGEQRVVDGVQLLVKAIGTVRDRQLVQVEHIRVKAEQLSARAVVFQSLELELSKLGEDASKLSNTLKEVPGASPAVAFDEEMGKLAAVAKSVAERATHEDFDDLSRVADGLRQQILAVRARLELITKPNASA